MKTLEESVKYTIRKKEHQISRLENSHFNESYDSLNKFLTNEKGRGSVALRIEYLSTWYHWNFIHNFISNDKLHYNALAKSNFYALECNNWRFLLGELVETFDSAISLTTSIKHLAQMLYLGQKERAVAYGNLLLKMLYGKQYDGGMFFPTHPWFMLELFCKWQGKKLEQKGTRYPDSLGVYERALDNWNTEDIRLVSDIIDDLTKFHIAQSDEDVTTDEHGNEFSPEFTKSNYFIFPVEILMWLSIRKDLGLPDYTPSPENKLMQMEINKLPEQSIPWPTDELVEKCKAKLKEDNPGVEFEL
ncbi:hypothetical protein [Zobellia laminariae]|uniref:hypothetical protein n=1 Tax=Zobellia laminariae TaxID=248906 RepID=UPI0026F433CE|nr:hypothetical protein [Zobellia laminariae]WKX76200.1 hypothetical protein Q5W13_21955 [Zobellia laminariae]